VDYELSDDQQMFRQATQQFLTQTMPVSAVREREALHAAAFDRGWWSKGAELGWTGMLAPEDAGGAGDAADGVLALAIVADELGRLVAPGPLLPTNVVIAALARTVDPSVHAALLESLVSGAAVAAWAVYDPGSSPWNTGTSAVSAVPTADGYRLNGAKDLVEAADQADVLLVTAEVDGGVAQFLVPLEAGGVTLSPLWDIDIIRHFSTVRLENVDVPASARLQPKDGDGPLLDRQLQLALVMQLAETAGVAARVFDFTLQWTFDRYSFGRPLASYQEIKHRIADLRVVVEAIQATAAAAAHAVQEERADATELVSVAKSYVGDAAVSLIQDCVQLHGAIGVTWEHDIHLYLRRAMLNRVLYGTPREHRRRLADMLESGGAL
jgi:alkylation response protein AidB-like acyl-CoA dehydrogenase